MMEVAIILQARTNDVCAWVKVISWTGLCRNQPGQCSALFTILVLNEPTDLGEIWLSIIFV